MRNLIAFPILGLAVILQSSIVSQVQLVGGFADLPLVLIAAWALQERVDTHWHWGVLVCLFTFPISNLPIPVVIFGYFGVIILGRILQRRIWQAPLLAMFSVVFIGTLFFHLLSFVVLRSLGTPLDIREVVGIITLPSLLLNMLLSIPMYAFMRDISYWVYPAEERA